MASTSALATSPGSYPGKASLEIFPKDCANQSPALFPREQLPPLSAIYLIHAGAAGCSATCGRERMHQFPSMRRAQFAPATAKRRLAGRVR